MTRDEYEKIRITDARQIAGKTVAAVTCQYGHALGIRFTDGTWFYAAAEKDGFCDDRPTLYARAGFADEPTEAHDLGLVTDAERDALKTEAKARSDEWDRARYAALKAKFEAADTPAITGQETRP